MLPISNILHRAKTKDKLNIIDFICHERYQNTLALTGHNFYVINGKIEGHKEFWNTKFGGIPSNYYMLPKVENPSFENIIASLPEHIGFDLILSHQKFGHFQLAEPLAKYLQIPLLNIEHTLPHPGWPNEQLQRLNSMRGDYNVFITKFNQKVWGFDDTNSEVIPHGVDTELFNEGNLERKAHILTVCNDYIQRNWCLNFELYQHVTQNLPVHPVGDTPGFSLAPDTTEDLVKEYQSSTVFLNTAHISPIPTSLLEAMACGCAVVSVEACAVPDYIENGVNGFMSNDPQELKYYLLNLLKDKKLCNKMGKKAKETILEKCNVSDFVNNWNNLFNRTQEFVYKG